MDDLSGVELASLRRRAAAAAIDFCVESAPLIAGSFAVARAYTSYLQRRGADARRIRLPDPSRRWQVAVWVLTTAGAVPVRNSLGPGARIMRLRRVDARTGGPVSVRSALIRSLVRTGCLRLVSHLPLAPRDEPPRAQPRLILARALLAPLVLQAPALVPPRHQGLPDRLAGIIVIVKD
jgi:RDD family